MIKTISVFLLLMSFFFSVHAAELTSWEQQNLEALKGVNTPADFSFYDIAEELLEQPEQVGSTHTLKRIFQLLLQEVYEAAKLLSGILLPVILFGVLQSMQLSKRGISNTAFTVCYAVVGGICITVFYGVADLAQNTMTALDSAVKGLIPVLFAVIAAGGGLTQASVVQPTVFMTSQVLVTLIHHFLMPMILLAFALHIANHFSDSVHLKLFGELFHKIIKWVLIFSLTVFVGIISIQSVAVTSMDAVKLKSARYAVNTLIPLIGGALAESLEAIGGSVMLIKNTVGIAGIIGVLLLCIAPVLKIFMIVCMLRLTAAICEPVSDFRFCSLLNCVADSTSLLGICVMSLAVIFIFAIAVTIGTANTIFML